MGKPIKTRWGNSERVQTNDWQAHNTAGLSPHPTRILPFGYEQDVLEQQDLQEKKAKVPYKRTNGRFRCDREENGSLPPLVLSFSTETRQPDKLAIRKVIWQAVPSAFAAPLLLLSIMKPCSLPLVNIKRIRRLQKTTDKQAYDSQCIKRTWLFELRGVSQSISCSGSTHTITEYLLCFIHKGVDLVTLLDEGVSVVYVVRVLIYVVCAPVCVCVCSCLYEAGYETKGHHQETIGTRRN